MKEHHSHENLNQTPSAPHNQWETLSEVEFAGDKISEFSKAPTPDRPEKINLAENLSEIKNILDTKTVAKSQDPEGLASAQQKDQDIIASCNSEQAELEASIAEYQKLSAEREEYLKNEYPQLISDKEDRERSRTHKILAFFHRPDKVLDKINLALSSADEKRKRLNELAHYSDEEKIENRKQSIHSEALTATNEDEFLSQFEAPLSREQKDKLLNYDTLAELSTTEYLKLWRHLNPQYVAHVTRQGYRDHNGMVFHTAGLGEMSNGFIDTLKTGKALQSHISLNTGLPKADLLENDDAFNAYMEENFFQNGIPNSLRESEDLSPSNIAATMGGGHGVLSSPDGFWRDRTAIHVAANNVANSHYGAETDNEVFYIFPADVILSQDSVSSGLAQDASAYNPKCMVKVGENYRKIPHTEEITHNDISIYVDKNLPLDAGLVFLPKDTIVDPNTGSKYQNFDAASMTGVAMTEESGGIRAEDYWENYFTKHPDQKPAHIIYYNGDPETAVAETLAENGIYLGNRGDTSSETGPALGFKDKIAANSSASNQQLQSEAAKFFAKTADYIRSKTETIPQEI